MRRFRDSKELDGVVAALSKSGKAYVVDFFGANCVPCRKLEPVLEELAAEFVEVSVLAVDIETHPDFAQRYGVRSVPTLIGVRGAQVRAQQVGFSNRRRLRELFVELTRDS